MGPSKIFRFHGTFLEENGWPYIKDFVSFKYLILKNENKDLKF